MVGTIVGTMWVHLKYIFIKSEKKDILRMIYDTIIYSTIIYGEGDYIHFGVYVYGSLFSFFSSLCLMLNFQINCRAI